MSMYARNNLLAFLLWNSIVNSAFSKVKRNLSSYWAAAIERYSLLLTKYAFRSDMPLKMPGYSIQNSLVGDLFGIAIIVLFIANLIGPVANFTTGITIAHTGFTPNPNVTASVGLVPLVQLIPFIFVAVLIFGVFNVLEKHTPHGL